MNFHSALNVVRDIVKANPDAMLVNEGANALDFTRSIVDMYKPRKRIDVGTWGIMGVGMGYCVAAAVVTKQQVIAIEGDSAFGFSGMEVETICRYNLPVCIVIMNNNGVYKGTDVDPTGGRDPAPTVFVKGARYDKLMEAFGGVGVQRHHAGRAAQGDGRGDPLAQADAHQRGDRRDRRHRKRPHHQPESDRSEEEVRRLDHGSTQGRTHPRHDPRAGGADLLAAARLDGRRRDQVRAAAGRRDARPAARRAERRHASTSRCSTATSARSRST